MITLRLPFPPSVNHYWRHARGRHYISERGEAYRKDVAWTVKLKRRKPLEGMLRVTIHATPPDKRRRDVDNLLKVPLDALQHGGLYRDDYQIQELRIVRMPPLKHMPHIEVTVEEVA